MFALLKNPVWNFISRNVPRSRRTERAPYLFCARLSIQSQYWKRPPHGKLTRAQLLCMENEGSYHWPQLNEWKCPNGTDDPASTPEFSLSLWDLFCQQTQGTWAREDKMQYIHDFIMQHFYIILYVQEKTFNWNGINWTCYACVWE